MILIRPAATIDMPRMWEIRTRAIRSARASHYSREIIDVWSASPMPASYAGLISGGGGMVAELDNCMLGYAILNMVNSEVDAAFIDPNHAGQGIGKKMLYALQDMACVHKLEKMHLLASLNAVEFYKSAGFSPIRNERLSHHSGVMLDCVYMEKELSGCTAGKM